MSCQTGRGFDGSYCMMEWVKGCANEDPSTLAFKRFGLISEQSRESTWNELDATSQTSPGNLTETVVGRMTSSGSFNYFIGFSDIQNQQDLITLIENPQPDTDYQPVGWIRLTDPLRVRTFPVIFTSCSESDPANGLVTGTINYKMNGVPIIAVNPNPLAAKETPVT